MQTNSGLPTLDVDLSLTLPGPLGGGHVVTITGTITPRATLMVSPTGVVGPVPAPPAAFLPTGFNLGPAAHLALPALITLAKLLIDFETKNVPALIADVETLLTQLGLAPIVAGTPEAPAGG